LLILVFVPASVAQALAACGSYVFAQGGCHARVPGTKKTTPKPELSAQHQEQKPKARTAGRKDVMYEQRAENHKTRSKPKAGTAGRKGGRGGCALKLKT
jgi:hypothetical protein